MFRLFCAFAICMFAAACVSPYRVPEVSKGGPIRGVAEYLGTSGSVRVILTHGMCSDAHRAEDADTSKDQTDWVALRTRQISAAIGGTFDPDSLYERKSYYGPGPNKVIRYDVPISKENRVIEATFLIWGRLVDPYREALDYENTRRADDPHAPIRATVNAALKRELMNKCILDAVVYLGPNGDPIRHSMRMAVCEILGGAFVSSASTGAATSNATCTNTRAAGVPTVLVPESLGSTILFDAYSALRDNGGDAAIAQSLSDVTSIFLASNQIPFLAQGYRPVDTPFRAETAAGTTDSLGRFLNLLGRAPALRAASLEPIQIVAITDPNDVLGYRLELTGFDTGRYEARNVLVSNTGTFLGVIADPIAAHRNTARKDVFEIIANGLPAP